MTAHLFSGTRVHILPASGEEALTGFCFLCEKVHSLLARVEKPKDVLELPAWELEEADRKALLAVEAEVLQEMTTIEVDLEPTGEVPLGDYELLTTLMNSPWERAQR